MIPELSQTIVVLIFQDGEYFHMIRKGDILEGLSFQFEGESHLTTRDEALNKIDDVRRDDISIFPATVVNTARGDKVDTYITYVIDAIPHGPGWSRFHKADSELNQINEIYKEPFLRFLETGECQYYSRTEAGSTPVI